MKILHVVSSYWPAVEFGGPIESVHLLNKELARKGVDITVYTTNAGLRNIRMSDIQKFQKLNSPISRMSDIQNIGKGKCEIDGVKVFYFPYYGYVHFTFSPALFWALAKNIKNFDLVHITGIWNFPVSAAAFWARIYKKPYIISPRGSLMKEPLEKKSSLKKKIYLFLIAKRDLKNAAAIHFTVEREKEEYLRAGLPLKKAIVIPNGIDVGFQEVRPPEISDQYFGGRTSQILRTSKIGKNLSMSGGRTSNANINQYLGSSTSRTSDVQKLDFRQKFGINTDKKIVLFLSRLNWKKGLDTLIPAFAEVIKKEPKADIVLAGPDENNYKKEIELEIRNWKLEINKDIVFTGMLVGEDKIFALQESDVFVLPSYSENFGMAVVEAMCFGLPVIITKNVGIAPSVEKAGAGIVIEKDEKQLAEAILKILNNSSLAKKMGENGRHLVETEFSPDSVAEKFLKVYNEVSQL